MDHDKPSLAGKKVKDGVKYQSEVFGRHKTAETRVKPCDSVLGRKQYAHQAHTPNAANMVQFSIMKSDQQPHLQS